jgi:hypothetical protein
MSIEEAGQWDYTLREGSRFLRTLQWQDDAGNPLPFLEGTAARSHIRKGSRDDLKNQSNASPILDITEYLTIDEAAGELVIDIPSDATIDLAFGPRNEGVHDIEIVPAGVEEDAFRWVEGVVTYSREATA